MLPTRPPLHVRAFALALIATVLGTTAPNAAAAEAPWWSAFREPALDQLMRSAERAPAPSKVALVQAWVLLRTDHARLALADRLLSAARAEEALLMNAAPDTVRDNALADIARRLQGYEEVAATIEADRDRLADEVARRYELDAADLRRRLDEAPRLVLPAVTITPPQGEGLAPEGRLIGAEADLVQREQWRVQARQSELQAAQARERAGEGDAVVTLRALQKLMLDSDRFALARGRLAMAWAQWLPAAAR